MGGLRHTHLDLGHRVDLLESVPGLPDLVFAAANSATVVGGVVYGARFLHSVRVPVYLAPQVVRAVSLRRSLFREALAAGAFRWRAVASTTDGEG